MAVDAEQPCFVVGTGRCGSTLLSDIVRADSDLLSLSELFTVLGGRALFDAGELDGAEFWELLNRPFSDLERLMRFGLRIGEIERPRARRGLSPPTGSMPPLLLATLPDASDDALEPLHTEIGRALCGRSRGPIAWHLDALIAWLRARLGRACVVERSGGSLLYLDKLIEGWPHAKFVHIVRDGCDTALSMRNHPYYRVLVARQLRRDERLPVEHCLDTPVPLERYGALWSTMIMRGLAQLERLPRQRVLTLRYEALLADHAAELFRLAQFIGRPSAYADWIEAAAVLVRPPAPRSSEATADELVRLARSCRLGARLLG